MAFTIGLAQGMRRGWGMFRFLLIALLTLTACSDPTDLRCYPDDTFAIQVDSVTDRITGASIIAGTSGYVIGGHSTSRFDLVFDAGHLAGGSGAGLYSIHLERPGYLGWDTAGVHVPSDLCNANGVTRLKVRLTPA